MSLWRWWPTTSLGDVPKNTFISLAVKASYAYACATPASSQTLDDRESVLSFSLSPLRSLLFRKWIISSTDRGGRGGCPRRLGARVSWGSRSDEGPLIHHLHVSGPKIGKRLILLGPHPGIHSLIKFFRHPCKRKTLVKKRKREDKISNMDELNTYYFFPQS